MRKLDFSNIDPIQRNHFLLFRQYLSMKNTLAYFVIATLTKNSFMAEKAALERLYLGCKLSAPFTFDNKGRK